MLLVGGCSAGASDSSSGGSAASSALRAEDSGSAAPAKAARGLKADSAAVTEASAQQQIRTAEVTVRVNGIDDAAARVRAIATGLGGQVQDENSTFGTGSKTGSKGGSVLTLRVPADQLDAAIARLGDVGRRLDLHTSSKDVTTTVADLDSRVDSQRKSVDRMRALLAEARSVKDIIAIESQLGSREADLESLQAQALAVKDKVALSTLVVTLKPAPAAPAAAKDDDDGFRAGLSTGWNFVKKTGVVALTVIGTLLPLGVVLAVIAVPAWFLYRRFGLPTLKPAANPPAPSAPGGTPSP
jgi:hypothetical protein